MNEFVVIVNQRTTADRLGICQALVVNVVGPSNMPPPSAGSPHDNALECNSVSAVQRFPHTRAQLLAIFRQYKGSLEDQGDNDNDESSRVSTALVTKVAGLLADEQEDELKALLRTTLGVDDDMVGSSLPAHAR